MNDCEYFDENDFARLGDDAFAAGFPSGAGYYRPTELGYVFVEVEEDEAC